MNYIYFYEDTIVLKSKNIKPLNEVVEAARGVLDSFQLDETKIVCYQKIY